MMSRPEAYHPQEEKESYNAAEHLELSFNYQEQKVPDIKIRVN